MLCLTCGSRAKCMICRINSLPSVSCGMGLAGEQDLHGPLRIGEDSLQPLDIAEQQGGPLVGGKATRETDRESVRGEDFTGLRDLGSVPPSA